MNSTGTILVVMVIIVVFFIMIINVHKLAACIKMVFLCRKVRIDNLRYFLRKVFDPNFHVQKLATLSPSPPFRRLGSNPSRPARKQVPCSLSHKAQIIITFGENASITFKQMGNSIMNPRVNQNVICH